MLGECGPQQQFFFLLSSLRERLNELEQNKVSSDLIPTVGSPQALEQVQHEALSKVSQQSVAYLWMVQSSFVGCLSILLSCATSFVRGLFTLFLTSILNPISQVF